MIEFNETLLESYKNYLLGNNIDRETVNKLPESRGKCFDYFLNMIIKNKGNYITEATPIELHPYLNKYPVEKDRMMLIIGTFPPFSYVGNLLKEKNEHVGNIGIPQINFFHGNELALWRYFANDSIRYNVYTINSVNKFMKEKSISITDIILACQRRMINGKYTTNDKDLYNIILNLDLIDVLKNPNSIKKLLFTNSNTFGTNGISMYCDGVRKGEINTYNRDAFSLFLRACQLSNTKIELGKIGIDKNTKWVELVYENRRFLKDSFKNKILFKIRIYINDNNYFEYIVNTLPSPSARGRIGLSGNAIYKHVRDNVRKCEKDHLSVDDFRNIIYKMVLNIKEENDLIELNQ